MHWLYRYFPVAATHYVKRVRIQSFSGPYFPSFGLNTERYSLSLRIQSKWGKIQTRNTDFEYGHFSRSDGHAVFLIHGQANPHSLPFFYVELVRRLSNNKFNYTPKQVHFLFISITIYDWGKKIEEHSEIPNHALHIADQSKHYIGSEMD